VYTVAFISQKGGVGKTTSVVNVGAAFCELDHSVLLIDLDPGGGLTNHLVNRRVSPVRSGESVRSALTGEKSLSELIRVTESGLHLVPSHPSLATVGVEVAAYAEQRLARALDGLRSSGKEYRWVLIDCPPSLDLLPLNALQAANGAIIPISPEVLPAATLPPLLRVIHQVRTYGNRPDLRVLGVLPCMVRQRTRLAREVLRAVGLISTALPAVRNSVKVAEAPGHFRPLLQYLPHHPAADDYRTVAREILSIVNGRGR